MKHVVYILIVALVTLLNCSCKKFITIDPPKTELVKTTVFSDDKTVTAAISAVYTRMVLSVAFNGGFSSIQVLNGFSADEYTWYPGGGFILGKEFYENSIVPTNTNVLNIWGESYNLIYQVNAIIEGLSQSATVSAAVKNQVMGEAKFMRAFLHFYLVNLYGDIPIITTTNYEANTFVSRNTRQEVYQQMIADLTDAAAKMASGYALTNNERVRPSRAAATSLLARVYLYNEEWANAEAQATSVINETGLYNLEADPLNVFKKNSREAIWQLKPVNAAYVDMAQILVLTGTPSTISASSQLISAFEPGDIRKTAWIGNITSSGTYYFPYKYKERSSNATGAEYVMVMRLAELYLIRAEARAKQGKLTGANSAEADINVIRSRAVLPNTTAVTQDELLAAIEQERVVELFAEWGHRWLDLKRTQRATAVLQPIKNNWKPTAMLLPLPQAELLINNKLSQNPGY